MTDNRWIISRYHFKEHKTIESMETELARLKAAAPGQAFHVYRIKRTVRDEDAETADKFTSALAEVLMERPVSA